MIKHTAGPWRVERQNPSPTTGEWMIAGGRPGYLAEVRDCGSGDVMANAKLIAEAPELLSLLKEARSTLEMWKDVAPAVSLCADIDKAIAKATTGEVQ